MILMEGSAHMSHDYKSWGTLQSYRFSYELNGIWLQFIKYHAVHSTYVAMIS